MNSNKHIVSVENVSSDKLKLNSFANLFLNRTAQFWFVIAVLGQWIFAYYVATFYGSSAAKGNFGQWNEVLPHGHIPGETMGNIAVAIHVFLAVIIIVGGPLQLIPKIRSRFPKFHRWNGRVYIITIFIVSVSGLYMVLTRGSALGPVGDVSVSINAILIMTFSIIALRYAMKYKINTHRRWALRLFLVVNGVWFFRIGLMLWLFIFQEPVGFDPETFRGPFLYFLGFAQYLLPLIVLELYFHTQDKASATRKLAMAVGLIIVTIAMGVGIFTATMGMWIPRL